VITLATNRLMITRPELARLLADEGIQTELTPIAPHGLRVISGRPLGSTAFRRGACLVQDEASQTVAELVQGAAGDRVWDVCASPGGKSVALAAQCRPAGCLVATDVRERRVSLLADTLRRSEATGVRIVHVASEGPLPFRDAVFDRVLVDAPCSGLGTVRRDPDIRWRRHASDLTELAARQQALLTQASRHVAAGGRLVYSTCSSEPEENEDVVAAFLASSPDFVLAPVAGLSGLPAPIARMATERGHWRSSPAYGLEAFFGAVLERTGVVR
jgi:16S rRNA (cytosine967-C5)-methyltransferase